MRWRCLDGELDADRDTVHIACRIDAVLVPVGDVFWCSVAGAAEVGVGEVVVGDVGVGQGHFEGAGTAGDGVCEGCLDVVGGRCEEGVAAGFEVFGEGHVAVLRVLLLVGWSCVHVCWAMRL